MKISGIDHVAVLVPDIDRALEPWLRMLGLTAGPRETVTAQKTEAAFVLTPEEAGACVELIAPAGENAGLRKFLEKNGDKHTLHHIAFAVDDLSSALRELDQAGVPLIDKVPRPGARGHQVAFLHPRATGGVLVELVSSERGCATRGCLF
jgi:methylmalonyl-CoA/ethylmalonyl-CoA epimerase